jgi:hypothetical protein
VKLVENRRPDSVVSACGLAQGDDARAHAHSRSTRSFRKCVAQEMHGS